MYLTTIKFPRGKNNGHSSGKFSAAIFSMYVKTWCTFVDSPLAFIKVISLKQLYANSKYISLGSFLFHFQPPRGKTDAFNVWRHLLLRVSFRCTKLNVSDLKYVWYKKGMP